MQTAVEHSRGIVEPFVRLFGDYPGVAGLVQEQQLGASAVVACWAVQAAPGPSPRQPSLAPVPPPPPTHAAADPPRTVTVAVTSDRGLCGGLNSNITKYTKALLKIYKGGACVLCLAHAGVSFVAEGAAGATSSIARSNC
jgi:hypothetical protein